MMSDNTSNTESEPESSVTLGRPVDDHSDFAALTKSTRWATPHAWKQNRHLISKLYESLSLKHVKAFMEEQHGFFATEKMYRRHVKLWGIEKNIKEHEARAMAHKYDERQLVNKESHFRVRNLDVPVSKLRAYWRKRSGMGLEEVLNLPRPPTPDALRCSTPLPGLHWTPGLSDPELFFCQLRDYIHRRVGDGTWTTQDGYLESSTGFGPSISTVQDKICSALSLFSVGQSRQGDLMLGESTSLCTDLVHSEAPDTIRALLIICMNAHDYGMPEVAQLLVSYTSDLTRITLGRDHSLTEILDSMKQLLTSCLPVIEAFDCLATSFEKALGSEHSLPIFVRTQYLQSLTATDPTSAIAQLKDLALQCETKFGTESYTTAFVQLALQNSYLWVESTPEHNDYTLSTTMTDEQSDKDFSSNQKKYIKAEVLEIMADSRHRASKGGLSTLAVDALDHPRQSIGLLASMNDPLTLSKQLRLLVKLEQRARESRNAPVTVQAGGWCTTDIYHQDDAEDQGHQPFHAGKS